MTKTILSILLCIRGTLVYTKNIYYIYQFLYLKIIAMGRKGLSKTISNKIRKHLSEDLPVKKYPLRWVYQQQQSIITDYALKLKGNSFPIQEGEGRTLKMRMCLKRLLPRNLKKSRL